MPDGKSVKKLKQVLIDVVMLVLGNKRWHSYIGDEDFLWRRWTGSDWEYRPMSDEERVEAVRMWAIR